MNDTDFEALYSVPADSDIMQHYPYKFDKKRVRDWAFNNTPFNVLYSYMKAGNIASEATAKSIGMHKSGEYIDTEQEITLIYTPEKQLPAYIGK